MINIPSTYITEKSKLDNVPNKNSIIYTSDTNELYINTDNKKLKISDIIKVNDDIISIDNIENPINEKLYIFNDGSCYLYNNDWIEIKASTDKTSLKDHTHSYNELTDKPEIPTITNDLTNELKEQYDTIVKESHIHSNKKVLDKFSESNGKILYNGEEISPDILNIFSVLNIHTSETELFNKIITIKANNSVICNTRFDNEGNATAILYKINKSDNPTYTVECEDIIESIIIDNSGQYDMELSFLSSYINVTTSVEGSTVIAELITDNGIEYKKEAIIDASGLGKIKIGRIGKYKVYSTYKTGISSEEIVEIADNNQTKEVTVNFAILNITTERNENIGINIVCKNGEDIITSFTSTGSDIIYLPGLNTYTIYGMSKTGFDLEVTEYILYSKSVEDMKIGYVCKIVSFSDGTDEEIITMINAHYNNDLNISDYWAIGDERTIHINEIKANSNIAETTYDQDINIRIIGIEHDDLVKQINGHTKACITIECVCLLNTKINNQQGSYIHGTSSGSIQNRFNWLNNDFKASIPATIGSSIKQVTKSFLTSLNTKVTKYSMYCFILTSNEIYNSSYNYLTKTGQGYMYEYYKTTSNILLNANFNQSTVNGRRWLFSLYTLISEISYLCRYNNQGPTNAQPTWYINMGLAPAFCL